MTEKNVDEAKGRVKEAAGALKDDRDLKREGRLDKAKSAAKDAIDKAADSLRRR